MLTVLPPRPQNEAVQALRRAQLQYVQRSEDLRVRSQVSPEDPAPQAYCVAGGASHRKCAQRNP